MELADSIEEARQGERASRAQGFGPKRKILPSSRAKANCKRANVVKARLCTLEIRVGSRSLDAADVKLF